jgi:AcrR family transcriptional regulator
MTSTPDVPSPSESADSSPLRSGSDASTRILDAALRLFAHQGFGSTPVRKIAEEADVATGLVYYHFTDKAGLLKAIFGRALAQVSDSLDEAMEGVATSPERGLDRLVRTAFGTVADHRDFWRLSYQIRMQEAVSAALGGEMGGWTEAIRGRIEALLREAGHTDPVPASRALFAAIDGAAQHFVLDPDSYPLDSVAKSLVAHFLPPSPR